MPAEYSVIILADNRVSAIQTWLRGSLAGRALLLGALVKSVTLTLGAIVPGPSLPIEVIDTVADVCLVAGALLLLYRLWVAAKRRLLWRVRRKLTLSYIFIGFVPVLLLITFFALCGLLLLFSMSSYLTQSRIAGLVDETEFLAQTTALELPRATDVADFQEMLARRQAGAARRYRFASYAVVPAERTCEDFEDGARVAASGLPRAAGPWVHLESPQSVPVWIPCAGSAAILAYTESLDAGAADAVQTRLVARAVAFPDVREPTFAVVVDIPIGAAMARQMFEDVGIELGSVTVLDPTGAGVSTLSGRRIDEPAADLTQSVSAERLGGLEWVTFLNFVDWETGETGSLTAAIQLNVLGLYRRISATSIAGIGDLNFGQILLVMLAVVAGLFFVIQIVAFGMGLALARSITGSVHALFLGTGRVRRGDFNHKIPIRSHDQLGELASSFNSMTASMEDLLRQKAEKERLEQELRVAREIQMSLLPQAPPSMPGLALTGYCRPAREVGGDYYDLLPIDAHRLGVLIADVSGKGTSAALYMAELKGVVLALSRSHRSPRQLLIEANQTLAPHLDSRSFITITYALVDLEAQTLTYARAGHCPLLYLPGAGAPSRDVQVLTPDGMVLGLQIDDGQMFKDQLQEVTLPLSPGDLFVLFTDGITEAMNARGEYFGDDRLSSLVRQHGELPVTELRERILEDVEAFVGSAPQQDDMTMLFVRVEDAAP